MRYFREAEVTDVVDLALLIDTLEAAHAEQAEGTAGSTRRVRAVVPDAMASAMAAVWPAGGVTGGKVYATKDGVFTFVIVLFDLDGRIASVIEANSLSSVRTAAASGVALRHLLIDQPEVATVFGTGRLCAPHLDLIKLQAPDVAEVRIVGRTMANVDKAVAYGRSIGLPAEGVQDPDAGVRGADVVFTLTASYAPLFDGRHLGDDVVIVAAGSTKAERVELDATTIGRAATVVVDSLEGSRTEAGDLLNAEKAGTFEWEQAIELSEMVAQGKRGEFQRAPGVAIFESQGLALQDLVVAKLAVDAVS